MRCYLSVVGTKSGKIPVASRVAVFRDSGETQEIRASVDGNVRGLGVADATVSRKKNGTPAVTIETRGRYIEVTNQRNSNGVTVRTNREEVDLDNGYSEQVKRDASIEIGYQTELRLTVEREARIEVGGDYVEGDQIDNSTEVSDAVLNRSDVGSGAPTDGGDPDSGKAGAAGGSGGSVEVDDSVVNRSNVGGTDPQGTSSDGGTPTRPGGPSEGGTPTSSGGRSDAGPPDDSEADTRNVCEVHDRLYTGTVCPECAGAVDAASSDRESCGNCGRINPVSVQYCPDCGQQL